MINMDESPTITLPISEFLEYLWGYKDKSFLSTDHERRVLEALENNTNESIFHLEKDGKVTVVWRARDWALAEQRYLAEKQGQEERVAKWEENKVLKEDIKAAILEKMAGNENLAITMAETIMKTRNIGLATALGCKEDLCKRL